MRYEAILFDLDGTLTDSYEGITRCVEYALSQCGILVGDRSRLRCFIGPNLMDSFQQFYGMDEEQAAFAVEQYRDRYRDTGIYENALYPGIRECLEHLKEEGMLLAIASSKPAVFVKRILNYFQVADLFDVVVGTELEGRILNKPQLIARARDLLGCSDCVMVGDRSMDAVGAQQNQMDFIGVTYGFGGYEELSEYPHVYLADDVEELEEYLLS